MESVPCWWVLACSGVVRGMAGRSGLGLGWESLESEDLIVEDSPRPEVLFFLHKTFLAASQDYAVSALRRIPYLNH